MATLAENVKGALSGTVNAAEGVQAAAVQAAVAASIPGPSPKVAGQLWRILIIGLSAALLISLVGIIWVVVDGNDKTTPDVLVTVFTATLTGLLGLFVTQPAT